ncbi:MAG: beta-glucosidase [Chitinivibrionales bacterium]|nr:beta-glucosidase [Chitinivibrionales bacterium]
MPDAKKSKAQKTPVYKDPSKPVDDRVYDLLSRMTLEEKVAQLKAVLFPWGEDDFPVSLRDDGGLYKSDKYLSVARHGLGAVAYLQFSLDAERSAAYIAALQRDMLENTRLGIPLLIQDECCHGHLAQDATVYPLPPALAATFDPPLVEKVFRAIGRETRARGGSQCFSPVLDIGRDPRWGRMEETFGEDPFLVSRMGVAAVRGLQGGDELTAGHVAASPKHFAGYGQSQGGRQGAPADIGPRALRDEILVPFEYAVREANARGIMPAYQEIDGVPCHANEELLTAILRKEWQFDGVVVSDFGGIEQLATQHGIAADPSDAARLALEAGVDMDLPGGTSYGTLPANAVDHPGLLKLIDRSVSRVLRLKFELGLFDNPIPDAAQARTVVHCEDHRVLALEAARKAIVLLKNDGGLLPLDESKVKRIAVIGPHARYLQFGGVSPHSRGISILEGLERRLDGTAEITWSQGCALTTSDEPLPYLPEPDTTEPPALVSPELEQDTIAQAVEAAKAADVAVICIGESSEITGESFKPTKRGDRASLELVGQQNALLAAVAATGTPVVVVLVHGRTLIIDKVVEHAGAVLDCWNLGEERGTAVAETLFGDANPGGRLPVTVPRSVGSLPCYYYRRPKGTQRGYAFEDNTPLFPFGYGLSYTTFSYTNVRLSSPRLRMKRAVEVLVDIANTGERAGDEVVQLYVRDRVASVTRPAMELRGFKRVSLAKGERTTVAFVLTAPDLAFTGRDMQRTAELGEIDVMVGPNAAELQSVVLTLVE